MSFLQKLSRLLLSLSAQKNFAAARNSSMQACQSLSSIFPGHVSFPHDQVYEDSVSSYAFIGTRLRPTCLVTPRSTNDVAVVIMVLGDLDSVAFAIRSGGHNTNNGFADAADGITIDLSAMNELVLKRSPDSISVGPGARWQIVYEALDPYNISIQGGRNGHVGLGGYLLGVNFEVVLPPGIIVNTNATTNADLFAALKGGLKNFGIVTRLDLQIFQEGPIDEELIETLSTFKEPEKFDPHAMFTLGFLYDTTTRTFSADIAIVLASMHWATITFHASRTTLIRIHAAFQRTSLALAESYVSANLTIACSIQSVPAATPASNSNSLGFEPSTRPKRRLFNLGIAFQYENPVATEGLGTAIMIFARELDQIAREDHADDGHLYLNYAGDWQDVLGGYGTEIVEKMRRVSTKYDGSRMFQRQVKGGFKLYKE
ncbi:hypothetical protein BDU57DRAFT_584703 [Ampelomyces quisqualis]|uniref:FAD-binding PCMH-type domain-containing protein n=1 Tax=Ampelomyces quisqualis TaxID=50730 RepID=A0A6A5R0P6_AMPQU|nr:hypothetical protein BDU57DRAFT_584703 [Ampelomyces quisqualis]